MKFLIIAPRFHTNLYYNVIALQNAGNEVKVAVLYKGKSEYYENVSIQVLNLSFFSKITSKIINLFKTNYLKTELELRLQSPNNELRKLIKFYKPDVIILKSYQELLAIKTLLIAKFHKIKVLMLTQTDKTHIKNSKFLFKININFFNVLNVLAYITPIKSNYLAFKDFGIKNVFYIPFVFPFQNNFENIDDNKIRIISIGKFTKRKAHLTLIQAVNLLIKHKNYDIELNIYGEKADEKYYDFLIDYVKTENIENQININTNLPYNQICEQYAKHHLFVLPSYAEPAAYSIVEAMCYGLPVICSSENGTQCYIENSKNGYVFEAKKVEDLIEKIELIISDKKILAKYSKSAIEFALQNHNPDNYFEKICEIISL